MLKQTRKILGSKKGFSLVEVVLFIVISGMLLGVTTDIMVGQVEAYSFLSNRQNTLSDARYALNRISGELIRVPTSGITSISANSIGFIDDQGSNTSFNLNGTVLRRGAETLMPSVASFQVMGMDANNNIVADVADVRKVQVTIVSAPVASEGNLTLMTTITPRVFIYNTYQ